MNAFVTALESEVTTVALWGALAGVASLIGVAILFAVGVHFLRRTIGGLGRGKAKI